MNSYAKISFNVFHCSKPHISLIIPFSQMYFSYIQIQQQLPNLYYKYTLVQSDTIWYNLLQSGTIWYNLVQVQVQQVPSNVSKCRRDSHHSSLSISPNCLRYDLLVVRFTDIVSHWSEACFLLKFCRSLSLPCGVDLLIRAITFRDGRFQLADEIVNVNGASLRYQIDLKHVWQNKSLTK